MLKPSEREKLQGVLLLIQSARAILSSIRPEVIPGLKSVQQCIAEADRKVTLLLHA